MSAVSARKCAANRRNAKLSTGPKTVEGKLRSSQNATTHGVFASDLVLPAEDRDAFSQLRKGMLARFAPRDVMELQLVNQIIALNWRIDRVRKAELDAHEYENEKHRQAHHFSLGAIRDSLERFVEATDPNDEDVDEDMQIPEDDHEKLVQVLKDTEESEIEPPKAAPLTAGQSTHRLMHDGELEKFSRYESRLSRELYRAMAELRKLKEEAPAEMNSFAAELIEQNEPTEADIECNSSDDMELTDDEPVLDESKMDAAPVARGADAQKNAHGSAAGSSECDLSSD